MFELQRIVLGNLPLIGISYQGKEKDNEYKEKFSFKDEMKKIIRFALQNEIKYFSVSSPNFNELSPLYLESLKEIEEEEQIDILLIACAGIPMELRGEKINDFKRWATHLTYETKIFGKYVRERYFADPILNCRDNWSNNLSIAKPYDDNELERSLRINWSDWEDTLIRFSMHKIAWIEPGSETDFLALSRMDLLEELLDRTYELGYRALLGSHHLGITSQLIEEERVKKLDGYVTPINKLGVMMFPTQRQAENAIKMSKKREKIIVGVKPFAGGRIEPKSALEYVYNEIKADSCMIGVASIEEAEKDIKIAKNILKIL